MVRWIFAGITLIAVLMATFSHQMRRAILALWVAGLGVGAIYLTLGAGFLAVIQWIVATLIAVSFMFFSVMFGEYNTPHSVRTKKEWITLALSIFTGICFTVVIGFASYHVGSSHDDLGQIVESDLSQVGEKLIFENLLSLEVLALILFLVLVGGGVIARTERDEQ